MRFQSINTPFCTFIHYNKSHLSSSQLYIHPIFPILIHYYKSKFSSSRVRISPATECPCSHTTLQFQGFLPITTFDSLLFLQSNMVKSLAKQNPQNSIEKMQPQFKGARMRKWGKWVSEVRMPNSRARIWLGSYDTAEQAARAFDCAVYCLRGSNADFNFPESLPEIPSASSLSPAQIQAVAAKFAVEESQLCVESEESVEEQNWILLDSLLKKLRAGSLHQIYRNSLHLGIFDFVLLE